MKNIHNSLFMIFLTMLCLMTVMFYPVLPECSAVDNETPVHGGELVIGLYSTPLHLNPAIQSGSYTGLPGAQLFAAPLRFDDQWHPQPYLAEKWDVAENGLSVTLHLVRNATFHDGHPITSEDVAFSIITVRDHHPFNTMFAPVTNVETPDPHTAVIRLKKPHPAILLAMSSVLLPVLPKHVYGDGQNILTHPANMKPVGSGPFKFVEFIPGERIVLERYDKFFLKGLPYLNKIIIDISKIFDPLSLGGEEIHILPFYTNPFHGNIFEKNNNLRVTGKGYEGIGAIYWLEFNLRKKPLDDLRVRQAIAYSIDRDFIVKTMFKGKVKPATGPVSSASPFYSADVEKYEVDVQKANKLLDDAGYLRDNTGKRFTLIIDFIPANIETSELIMEYLQYDLLGKIGVEIIIRNSENFSQWKDNVSNGKFELSYDSVYNWGDPVIGVHRTYDCNNIRKGVIWSNMQGYCNPKVNELMEAAGSEMNFEKRKALYAEFQKIVVHDLPIYFLMEVPFLTIYNKNLKNINDSVWGVLSPLDRVYWKKTSRSSLR